jgi:hypothetical protein
MSDDVAMIEERGGEESLVRYGKSCKVYIYIHTHTHLIASGRGKRRTPKATQTHEH